MNEFNNCIRAALKLKGYFGREAEMLLAWAKDEGAKSDDVETALLEVLRSHGAMSLNLDDAWIEIYNLMHLTGTTQEKKGAFWIENRGDFPVKALIGWTGKEFCANE